MRMPHGRGTTAPILRAAEVSLALNEPLFHWASAGKTHTGHVRRVNEDAYLQLPQRGLWVVADGMGGHAAGDYASGLIIEALRDVKTYADPDDFLDDVERRLVEVNRRVFERGVETERTIGSTIAAVLGFKTYCVCLWAGDSRVYRVNEDGFEQLTRDHSQVEDLVASGHLAREDIADHPLANVITRAVGGAEKLRLEAKLVALDPGDRLLLCSDGLYKDLRPDEIAGLLAEGDADYACSALLDRALLRGGGDNVTAIVIDCHAAD